MFINSSCLISVCFVFNFLIHVTRLLKYYELLREKFSKLQVELGKKPLFGGRTATQVEKLIGPPAAGHLLTTINSRDPDFYFQPTKSKIVLISNDDTYSDGDSEEHLVNAAFAKDTYGGTIPEIPPSKLPNIRDNSSSMYAEKAIDTNKLASENYLNSSIVFDNPTYSNTILTRTENTATISQ